MIARAYVLIFKDNYASWSLHMEVALDYGNLWEVTVDPPKLLVDY